MASLTEQTSTRGNANASKSPTESDPSSVRQMTKAFYSTAQLAERWGVSKQTVAREVERGRLSRKVIGNQVRFEASEVARYERQA